MSLNLGINPIRTPASHYPAEYLQYQDLRLENEADMNRLWLKAVLELQRLNQEQSKLISEAELQSAQLTPKLPTKTDAVAIAEINSSTRIEELKLEREKSLAENEDSLRHHDIALRKEDREDKKEQNAHTQAMKRLEIDELQLKNNFAVESDKSALEIDKLALEDTKHAYGFVKYILGFSLVVFAISYFKSVEPIKWLLERNSAKLH